MVVWVGSPDETPRRWNDGSIVRGTMDLLFGLTIGYCSIMKTLCYRVKILSVIGRGGGGCKIFFKEGPIILIINVEQ